LLRVSDTDELVKVARTINTIATALQDRGGYPKTERTEQVPESTDPRPHKDKSTEELRAKIRLLKGQHASD